MKPNISKKKINRHGDLTFEPITKLPSKLKKHSKVIKEGEQSGHYHQFVESAQVQCFVTDQEQQYISVATPAIITHPEHKQELIPKGEYKIRTSRELDLVGEVKATQD